MGQYRYQNNNLPQNKYKINEEITSSTLRVISEDGEPLGVMEKEKALEYAKSKYLDLIEVAAKAKPPVAKVELWSKFKFELLKKEKIAKKKNKNKEIKEMWFQPLIGKNDIDHKVKRIKEFIEDKHSVKIVIKMKGRINYEMGDNLMKNILLLLEDVCTIDTPPKREMKQIMTIVRPSKK